MKKIFTLFLISSLFLGYSQQTEQISMIDYVQVLNNNKSEALFYYQNNWQQLRIKAIEKGYIESYKLLETTPTQETPYTFILLTTYKNKRQYDESEKNFREIINSTDGLKLLNEKKPNEFRKVVLHNGSIKHWN